MGFVKPLAHIIVVLFPQLSELFSLIIGTIFVFIPWHLIGGTAAVIVPKYSIADDLKQCF